MDPVFMYGFPAGALLIGAIAFFVSWRDSRDYDRRYGPDTARTKKMDVPSKHRPA